MINSWCVKSQVSCSFLLSAFWLSSFLQGICAEPISFDQYATTVKKIDAKKSTIGLAQLRADLKNGVTILDLRSDAEYKNGHIKGAKLLGADVKEELLNKLAPDKKGKIIVYCTNCFYPSRRISLNNVCLPQIVALGYANVYMLDELWHEDMSVVENLKKEKLWEP